MNKENSPGSLVKSASVIAGGAALGQIIAFVASLLLVRIYTPEQFGVFTTLTAVAACIVPFATGRFELAIPIPTYPQDALRLGRISIALATASSTLLILITLIVKSMDSELLPQALAHAWALPSLILALGLYQTANQLAVRTEMYKKIAARGFAFPLVMSISQISFGWFGSDERGLIIGLVLGHVVGFVLLQSATSKKFSGSSLGGTRQESSSYRELGKRFRRFPILMALSGSLNALATQFPQIAISFMFGLTAAGEFGIMMKILALPVALIGQSISYVYTGKLAKITRDKIGDPVKMFLTTTCQLLFVSLVIVVAIIFFGPTMFSVVLGTTWSGAGELARIFAVAIGAQLIVAPLSQSLLIAGRTDLQFAIDAIRVVSIFVAIFLCSKFDLSLESTVISISWTIVVGYAIMWLTNWRVLKSRV